MKLGALVKSDFVESEHPRDADGKFADGPGGGGKKPKDLYQDHKGASRMGEPKLRALVDDYQKTWPQLDDEGAAYRLWLDDRKNDESERFDTAHYQTYVAAKRRLRQLQYKKERDERHKAWEEEQRAKDPEKWAEHEKNKALQEAADKAKKTELKAMSNDDLAAEIADHKSFTELSANRKYREWKLGESWRAKRFNELQDEVKRRANSGKLDIGHGERRHAEVPAFTGKNKAEVEKWAYANILRPGLEEHPQRLTYLNIADKKFVDTVTDAVYDNLRFTGMPPGLSGIVKGVSGRNAIATATASGILSVNGQAVRHHFGHLAEFPTASISVLKPGGKRHLASDWVRLEGPFGYSASVGGLDVKTDGLRATLNHEMGHFLWFNIDKQTDVPFTVSTGLYGTGESSGPYPGWREDVASGKKHASSQGWSRAFMDAWSKARSEEPEKMAMQSIYGMKDAVEGFAEYYAMFRDGLMDEFPAPIRDWFKKFQEHGGLQERAKPPRAESTLKMRKSAEGDLDFGQPLCSMDEPVTPEDDTIIDWPGYDFDVRDAEAKKTTKLGDLFSSLVKTATFVETEHPRDEKGRFDFSQHTLMNPPKVQTFRCNRSGCKHWAYNQYGAQSHQDAHTFDDHGGYHRVDVADSDWQPSYDGPDIWRSASEPFTGKDGKTWYQIPWTGHEDAKPLGTFIRDELVNEQRRGGDENRYHAAVKTMRALADAVDGKEVAAPEGVEDWNALVEIAKTEHEKAAAEWDEAHPNGGVLYRGISPQAAKAFLESHKEGDTTTLPGTMSTSDDWGQALGFSGEYKDKAGDYMTGGGAILEFLDVRGEDVFQSYRTLPQAFTLPVSKKGDKPQSEHEIQMRGKRPWKIRSIKWEPDGTRNVISLEPATEKSQGQVWDFELFVPKAERMTLGRLIKTVDENGAKHDANGQFSATSGSAKPKKPKAKSPFVGQVYSSFSSGPHPATGEDVKFLTANHEWGGYVPSHMQEQYGTTKRWDSMLVDLGTESLPDLVMQTMGDDKEKNVEAAGHIADVMKSLQANKELIRAARGRTDQVIMGIENAVYGKGASVKHFSNLNPHQRGKIRDQYAAVYYDHNRMHPCIAGTNARNLAAIQYLMRTRDLAKHIAESKPKTLEALRSSAAKAYQTGEIQDLQPGDVEREWLMYKHSLAVSEDLDKDKLLPPQAGMQLKQRFAPDKMTPERMGEIAIALDLGLGSITRSKHVTTVQYGRQQPGGNALGCAFPDYGVMCVSGQIGPLDDFCTTVNHEMCHALSKLSLAKEMSEFNKWMFEQMTKVLKPREQRWDASDFLTGHGFRSGNQDYSDFQEDWAIGLSEFVVGLGGKPNPRGYLDGNANFRPLFDAVPKEAPRRETVEKLGQLFGKSVAKDELLAKLKPMPLSQHATEYALVRNESSHAKIKEIMERYRQQKAESAKESS